MSDDLPQTPTDNNQLKHVNVAAENVDPKKDAVMFQLLLKLMM